jgi:hypothetical protein
MDVVDAPGAVGARYRRYAARNFRGISPTYEALALGVAGDAEVLAWLAPLPFRLQQPLLLFAAVRFLGGDVSSYDGFRAFVLSGVGAVEGVMTTRRTQTNEVGRCAVLLPALAAIRGPLAIIEAGASAGLCLLADRYHYDYGARGRVGDPDSPVRLSCRCLGDVPVPERLPDIVWRMGIDLDPVDLGDADDTRWLRACVWPEQLDRRRRLEAAMTVARTHPPSVVAGDAAELLRDVAAAAPRDATLVVVNAAMVVYLDPASLLRYVEAAEDVAEHWITLGEAQAHGRWLAWDPQ